MSESRIEEQNALPVASIILALVACMMAFSGTTSYFVDAISYSRINAVSLTYMATYVVMFAATVVITVGYALHLRNKQHLVGVGSFMFAACVFVQNVVVLLSSEIKPTTFTLLMSAVQLAVLVVLGLYYYGKKVAFGNPVKTVLCIIMLGLSLANFVFFLLNPQGEYLASWNMYPFFTYIAYMLYTPFEKEK